MREGEGTMRGGAEDLPHGGHATGGQVAGGEGLPHGGGTIGGHFCK